MQSKEGPVAVTANQVAPHLHGVGAQGARKQKQAPSQCHWGLMSFLFKTITERAVVN